MAVVMSALRSFVKYVASWVWLSVLLRLLPFSAGLVATLSCPDQKWAHALINQPNRKMAQESSGELINGRFVDCCCCLMGCVWPICIISNACRMTVCRALPSFMSVLSHESASTRQSACKCHKIKTCMMALGWHLKSCAPLRSAKILYVH